MKKNKMIIVEGPQGTGKTTLANYLRDNLSGSNLYRLSGQKDKTKTGKKRSKIMYKALLKYLKKMQKVPMTLIFDRTFFTEEVYARLGYKEYEFSDIYYNLLRKLAKLNYDICYISLYLDDVKLFEKRLARDSHHNYQAFSLKNSSDQQNVYKDLADELEEYDNITVTRLAMDDFDKAYNKIDKLFKIKEK